MHDALRVTVRRQAGKAVAPIGAIIDSRSVKTAQKEGNAGTAEVSEPGA